MELSSCGVDVNIQLNKNGIYLLDVDSATGKSYFTKLIKAAESKSCLGYSKQDIKLMSPEEFLSRVDTSVVEVIVMDRVDLYISDSIEALLCKIKDKVIILLDLKSGLTGGNACNLACVELGRNRVVVKEL